MIIALIQLIVPVGFGLLSIMLGQDINWDIQNYHLYNPYAFLNGRLHFDLAPAGLQSYFTPYLDMVYFQGIRYMAPWKVGFLIGFIQGLNFMVLLNICSYCLKSISIRIARWAMLLAFLGVLSIGFLSELGTVYWDNVVSLFPLTSLLIVLASMDSIVSGKRGVQFLIVFAGIIAGMGAGLKLVAVLYAVSLLLSFFFILMSWKRKWVSALFFGGGLAIGLMMGDGAWLWNIWDQMGNPIFPNMNNIFHGELAAFSPIHDVRYLPRNFVEMLFYPAFFTMDPLRVGEVSFNQISWLIVYLAGSFSFLSWMVLRFYKKEKNALSPQVKYLFSFFWFSYLFWANLFGFYRYQITIEILIPLVLFVLFSCIDELRLIRPGLVAAMLVFMTIINLHGIPDNGHSPWADKVFRFETAWVQKGKVDSVILLGQPLAWIIPALDIKVPFIQIMPGFPISQSYQQRVESMLKSSGNGKTLVIFQPWVISRNEALSQVGKYGFSFNQEKCTIEKAYLGTQSYNFVFCPAERIKDPL